LAVLPVRILPDPVLRRKAVKVTSFDASLQKLIDDMIDTMHEQGGVGIAANQVGVLRRVVIIQLPEDEEPRVLINPEITLREGERIVEEGCLSIPGYRGRLKRSVKVHAKALDRKGKAVRIKAENDLLAQALEHEIDHLNGILYIDHLASKEDLWKIEVGEEEATPEESRESTAEVVQR